jgi:hypothetical protein
MCPLPPALILPPSSLCGTPTGGERQGVCGGPAEVVEEVRALDTEIFLWYPPAVSGKPPSARCVTILF